MPENMVLIGTSGWHYPHWSECFYPAKLPKSKWLAWYASYFSCFELNNSFYKLPNIKTIRQWLDQTPDNFVFALKASRLMTHLKKLKNCQEVLDNFLDSIRHFENKLGPILFQLPPHWHINTERLEAFLELLPPELNYVFGFRDPSWHNFALQKS